MLLSLEMLSMLGTPLLSSSSPPKKFNIFNISFERNTFSQKTCFKGNVACVEFWGLNKHVLLSGVNVLGIQHVQHFCRKKHILIQHVPQNSTYSTFPLKERHFSENVFLFVEMLNILGMLCVNGECPE